MRVKTLVATMAALCCAMIVARTGTVAAQDEEKRNWFLTTEFSVVSTTGNTESSTFGLDATLRRVWERAEAKIDAGGIRTESVIKSRTAVGTSPVDFQLFEEETREKTAENYYVRGRYDYSAGKRFTVFGGADWMRNVFSGIESRVLLAGGLGNAWWDNDELRFKTFYSATYTFEEEVVSNPFVESNFPGARFSYDLWYRLTGTTEFTSLFIFDWNLDNTKDMRIDFTNTLPVSISSNLVLKPSLQLLWRNEPALTKVSLFDSGGNDTGETVFVPLEELDTVFKVTLVVNY